jgi:HK97 family phage prohead protease
MDDNRTLLALDDVTVSDTGEFAGYGNVVNVVDDGGDKVLSGAFNDALPRFLKEGFVSWGHDWNDPVAMPVEAYEDQKGLFLRAQFHGTPRGQEARQIVQERAKVGLAMGLSIGYEVGKATPTSYGRDIASFNRIFEVALAMVPMNGLSNVTAIKGSLGSGLPFAERLELVLAEAKAVADHSRERADLRLKEGRVLSGANRERLGSLKESLAAVLTDIDELLRATDPARDESAAKAALARAYVTLAGV